MKFKLVPFILLLLILGCSNEPEKNNDLYLSDDQNYIVFDFDDVSDIQSNDTSFTYLPVGKLLENSGEGVVDYINYSPNMTFPLKNYPAYCNSQVYNYGGYYGPKSRFGWKDQRNYSYPWVDNFCEKRTKYSCCSGKKGHQGQDIRPATYHDLKYEAVACEDGVITRVGNYSVRIMSSDGLTEYNYLHLDKSTLKVRLGDNVSKGQILGYVSNDFGGTPTTIHLHFEIRKAIKRGESSAPRWQPVSPYIALVESYKRLILEEENRSILLNDSIAVEL